MNSTTSDTKSNPDVLTPTAKAFVDAAGPAPEKQFIPPKSAIVDMPSPHTPLTDMAQHGAESAAPVQQEKQVTHVLTDVETNLLTHAYTGDVDWAGVVEALDDYEIMRDAFEVPPECMVRQERKEFRYRWLNPADRERFDMQTSGKLRWWVCNRTNASYIPDQYRDANGLVRRSGLVLAKMPYAMYLKRQTTVWQLATPARKVGPANSEGYEYTGEQGGKFRKGDIIHAEERVVHRQDPQTGTVREDSQVAFYKEGKRYTGDAPDAAGTDVFEA